jgi:hypothetical protein
MKSLSALALALFVTAATGIASAETDARMFIFTKPAPATVNFSGPAVSVLKDAGQGKSCTPERASLVKRDKQAIQSAIDQIESQRSEGLPDSMTFPEQPAIRLGYRKTSAGYVLLINRRPGAPDEDVTALFTCSTMHMIAPSDAQRLRLYVPHGSSEPAAPMYYTPYLGLYLLQ